MNVYDSIKMGDLLKPHGFEMTDQPEGADMVILNTCHIREKASEKVYSELGRIREEKNRKKANGEKMLIAVAGCVAQAEGEEIVKRAPYVDIVVGSQSYHTLPKLIEEVKRTNKWAIDLDFPTETKFDALPEEGASQGVSAFIAIQEGCDKFCHFCVVPYTRGAEYSRSVSEIYREALILASKGTKEIQLLGQNVSAYHGEGPDGKTWSLGKLIRHIAKIDGIERIRYSTSHPRDMTDPELFEAHRDEKKLMPYLHLPVQSGSDKILDAMNRKHTRDFYFEVIERFKQARPDMAFSSDFIVGYPGETEQDFEDTMDLVKKVTFVQGYSFNYSARPGTPASMHNDQITLKIKNDRLYALQALLREQQQSFNKSFLGKTIEVLFESDAKLDGQIQGKSEYMQTVLAYGSKELFGKIVPVRITRIHTNTLEGEIIVNS